MNTTTDITSYISDEKFKLHRKEIQQRYREKNREKIRERNRIYVKLNREKVSKSQKARRERERIVKGIKKYERPLTINSPFVRAYASIKNSKKHICTITIDDIREKYEAQNGLCALSGIKMYIPKKSSERNIKMPNNLSIDRIDSSKEYKKDNIQLVCLALNYAKNNFSNNDMIDFIKSIKNYS